MVDRDFLPVSEINQLLVKPSSSFGKLDKIFKNYLRVYATLALIDSDSRSKEKSPLRSASLWTTKASTDLNIAAVNKHGAENPGERVPSSNPVRDSIVRHKPPTMTAQYGSFHNIPPPPAGAYSNIHRERQLNRTGTRDIIERRCGLKLKVNGKATDGFGDTGSSHTIVDEAFAKKHNLRTINHEVNMTMGNGGVLQSSAYAEVNVGFAGEKTPPSKVIARVVKNFPFDILLSRSFLQATHTLQRFQHRFTKCIFPRLTAAFAMNFLSGERHQERFHGTFNSNVDFAAVLDTGSNCNAMSLAWARRHGLRIHTNDKYRGWISLPSNQRVPTVGRVFVNMDLDDASIPLEFQVLEHAAVPVVLGDDVVLDYDLLSLDSNSRSSSSSTPTDHDDVLHMGYEPWYIDMVDKAKRIFADQSRTQPNSAAPTVDPNEYERRWKWNKRFQYGRTASAAEWVSEYTRRETHERAVRPGADGDDAVFSVRLVRDVSTELLERIGQDNFRSQT